uniref:Uncharacterized protein n=1 Tax=Knipowitschia caucasica TaxID=637954 RepID=A0AAV2K2A9_KNICA
MVIEMNAATLVFHQLREHVQAEMMMDDGTGTSANTSRPQQKPPQLKPPPPKTECSMKFPAEVSCGFCGCGWL